MTKNFRRVLGTAAIALTATLASAAPATADLIGTNLQGIGIGSQNCANNNGDTGTNVIHGSNDGNNALNCIVDSSNIGVVQDISALNFSNLPL